MVGFGYLSFVGTALAFVLWFNGIRRLPSHAPPLLGLAAPITGAVVGWVMLHQSLSTVQIVGFALTMSTIVYGTVRGAGDEPAPSGERLHLALTSRKRSPVTV